MKKREYLVLHFDGSPTDKQRHTIEEGDIGFVACTFRRLYRKPTYHKPDSGLKSREKRRKGNENRKKELLDFVG